MSKAAPKNADARMALAHVLTQPLAINEQWIELFKGYAANPQSILDYANDAQRNKNEETVTYGACVLDVSGPLSKEDTGWSWLFGGTSYAQIRHELDEALDTGLPVVLNINSPGGDVYGVSELADYILAARANGAQIDAYIAGQGDSAAYWIASACGKITINASGEAGSIGVRCVLVDASKMEEALGISVYDVVADQSPLKVVDASSAKDRDRVKAQMTSFASVFVDSVARGRGVSVATVLSEFGKGDVMVGQAAVDAGLADEVGTLDSVLAALTNSTETMNMSVIKGAVQAPAAPAANVANGKCSSCKTEMGDSAPMYCKKCMNDDDDDADAKKAHTFHASVMALLGEADESKAIGLLVGMKAQAAKCSDLESQIAAIRKEQAQTEAKGAIDAACADGRVTPSARAEFEALYAEHGMSALSAALKVLKPAAPVVLPADDKKAAEAAKSSPSVVPALPQSFTKEQLEVFRVTGITPEQYLAQKSALKKHINGGEDK